MAMVFTPLNAVIGLSNQSLNLYGDNHKLTIGGKKAAFFALTFNNTAVQGVDGDTYDPTNHYTTQIHYAAVAGSSVKDLFGIDYIEQVIWSNGSSDTQVQVSAAADRTNEAKAVWVENGQYIQLKAIGTGGTADPLTAVDEAEIDTNANNMSALRFTGLMIGV